MVHYRFCVHVRRRTTRHTKLHQHVGAHLVTAFRNQARCRASAALQQGKEAGTADVCIYACDMSQISGGEPTLAWEP